jgi:uncharacterized membrane protein YhfC
MVSTGGMIGLGVAVLISVCLPLLVYLVCRGRMSLRARNILVGACCFIFFALVLESLLHRYLLIGNPATATWFKAHRIGFALYGALAAGVFEETARLLGLSVFARKEDGAGVAYGIGHGGAEAIIIGALGFGNSLMLAVLLNQGKLAATLGPRVPPEALAKIQASLEQLTFFGALPGALERASALVLQIALSVLVWRAVRDKLPLLFFAAIFAHAAADMPAALLRAGVIHMSTWAIEGIYAAIAVVLLAIMLPRLPPRLARGAA